MFQNPVKCYSLKEGNFKVSKKYFKEKSLEKQRIHTSADMWALGAIIYSIIFGKPPSFASNFIGLQTKLKRWKGINKQQLILNGYSNHFVDFLSGLLQRVWAHRMGVM